MADLLIVEDEKNMQEIIVQYMKRGGHICFTADDGIDALMALKNHPMDLMILDIMIPNLDGFSVCKMAREMSNLPIIMLTAKESKYCRFCLLFCSQLIFQLSWDCSSAIFPMD